MDFETIKTAFLISKGIKIDDIFIIDEEPISLGYPTRFLVLKPYGLIVIGDYNALTLKKILTSHICYHISISKEESFLKVLGTDILSLKLNFPIEDVKLLNEFPGLLDLTINDSSRIKDISKLETSNFTSLCLDNLTNTTITKSNLTKIKNLQLFFLHHPSDLSFLSNIPDLSMLELSSKIPNIIKYPIPKLSDSLKLLFLRGNFDLQNIRDCKNIEELDIANILYDEEHDFSFLSEFPKLIELQLTCSNIKDISFLLNLKNLKILTLNVKSRLDLNVLCKISVYCLSLNFKFYSQEELKNLKMSIIDVQLFDIDSEEEL